MVQTAAASGADSAAGPRGLAARLVGVLFSPRAAYAEVASRPRWLGAFLVVYLTVTAVTTSFMATEVGRSAALDLQMTQFEAYGRQLTQEQIDRLQTMSRYYVYMTPISQLIVLSLIGLLIAGVSFAVFNALLGGDASFKQVFAVVAHSGVIYAVLSLFTIAIAYANQKLESATSLWVFFRQIFEDNSFAARLLGSIDLGYIWCLVSLSIGLGVLYRKRTGPIATTMIAIYAVIGIVIAAIKTALSGA